MRPIWSGSISFGLVSVPVRMYSATESKELLELIRAKAKGKALPEPKEEEDGEVVDLMAALRESVARTQRKQKKKAKRPAKKAS
jgi:non-homologous end joining protein Ku